MHRIKLNKIIINIYNINFELITINERFDIIIIENVISNFCITILYIILINIFAIYLKYF